jgi:hypothetical protein
MPPPFHDRERSVRRAVLVREDSDVESPLDLRILGSLEVVSAGRRVVIEGRRARVLLAMLPVWRNQTVSLDALTEGLWPQGPPSSARTTLHAHISRLRGALAAGPLAGGERIGRQGRHPVAHADRERQRDRPVRQRHVHAGLGHRDDDHSIGRQRRERDVTILGWQTVTEIVNGKPIQIKVPICPTLRFQPDSSLYAPANFSSLLGCKV